MSAFDQEQLKKELDKLKCEEKEYFSTCLSNLEKFIENADSSVEEFNKNTNLSTKK